MRSLGDEDAALETLEHALAVIRRAPDRDENTERVIRAIEDERARLIASKLRRAAEGRDRSRSGEDPEP
jgi:hypothetical protein